MIRDRLAPVAARDVPRPSATPLLDRIAAHRAGVPAADPTMPRFACGWRAYTAAHPRAIRVDWMRRADA